MVRDNRDTYLDESLKLYVDVRKMSNKDVSLVTVKDHAQNTLNLIVATQNRVEEMRLNLENIHFLDMIHLHKQTGEFIYNDFLKATMKVSRLQSTETNIENKLRQERVENKAHQQQIKLWGELLAVDSETNKGEDTQKRLAEKEKKRQSNC